MATAGYRVYLIHIKSGSYANSKYIFYVYSDLSYSYMCRTLNCCTINSVVTTYNYISLLCCPIISCIIDLPLRRGARAECAIRVCTLASYSGRRGWSVFDDNGKASL